MKRLLLAVTLSLTLLLAAVPVYADTVYVVQPGDTLSQIAVKTGISMQAIIAANGLTNPNLLFAGQRLVIPPTSYVPPASTPAAAALPAALPAVAPGATQGTYKVMAGDTLYKVSRLYGVTLQELAAANHMANYYVYVNQVLVIPVHGAPTATPTATPAPAAAAVVAPPSFSSRGVNGDYLVFENPVVGPDDTIWFDFQVTNTGGRLDYAVLSIHSDSGINGKSWTNDHLNGGQVLTWRDHISIDQPGNFLFYLAVCYDSKDACLSNQATWERLSKDVLVSVTLPGPWTGYNSRGVVGNAFFVEGVNHYTGDPIWFDFQVVNTNNGDVNYSVLSALVDGVAAGQSWTNSHLTGSQVLAWRDHIDHLGNGTYAFFLAICYSGKDQCMSNQGLWERLSNNVYVTVTDHP
jgi:LysM repeat protein